MQMEDGFAIEPVAITSAIIAVNATNRDAEAIEVSARHQEEQVGARAYY